MAGVVGVDWRKLTLRQLLMMYEGVQQNEWGKLSEVLAGMDCLRYMLHLVIQTQTIKRLKIHPPRDASSFNPFRLTNKSANKRKMRLTPKNLKLLRGMVIKSKRQKHSTVPYITYD